MKITSIVLGCVLLGLSAFSQPISDRSVVPVAVTLNQILRMNIIDGGNIEFSFNSIADYESGLSNSAFYDTRFNVAASMPWRINVYAESSSLVGTDDPSLTMSLNHVAFSVSVAAGAAHAFGTELVDVSTYNAASSALRDVATTTIIGSTSSTGGSNLNTGDIDDNSFTIHWEVGTGAGAGGVNQTSLINMGYLADRYVTNVFFELATSSDL
jgi:hypothetical protein